jgi:tetratricopeptide (TPR) repeat protein
MPDLTPQRRRERLLQALLRRVRALAARRPVLAVVEDAHWVDPTTRELLDLLVAAVPEMALLMVVTCRPEFDAGAWLGQAQVTLLQLNRLGQAEHMELLRRVARGKALPADVEAKILAHTDGVPLFVEEVTRAVLEGGLLREEADRWTMDGPLPPLAIPATLQASLAARLDRLSSVREVAQVGAAVGREFAYDLAVAVSGLPEAAVGQALAVLEGAGLLQRRGTPPEAVYAFKHALLQDAAHGALLRERRRELHARIAEAIKQLRPEVAEREPHLLAQHYTEAGLTSEAVSCWEAAARRAMARSAQREGSAHLRNALELLRQEPEDTARRARELRLLLALGGSLFGANQLGAEVQEVFARAKDLALRLHDHDALCRAYYGVLVTLIIAGEIDRAAVLGRELEGLSELKSSEAAVIVVGRTLGTALYLMGDLAGAERRLSRALDLFRRGGAIAQNSLAYTHHPGLTLPATLSHVTWALGFPDQALALSDEALEWTRALNEPNSLGYALHWATHLHILRREPLRALALTEQMIRFGEERGSGFWQLGAEWRRGAALIQADRVEEGLGLLTSATRQYLAGGGRQNMPFALCCEAGGYLKLGRFDECFERLDDALRMAREGPQKFYEPEIHRTAAAALRVQGRTVAAEASYREALGSARQQGARSWELRAAGDLARLWRDQGRIAEAREVLAPVYASFTEGFARPDLVEAKTLLDELEAGGHQLVPRQPAAAADPR